MRTAGGEEVPILSNVRGMLQFSLTTDGIYYTPGPIDRGVNTTYSIHYYDFATQPHRKALDMTSEPVRGRPVLSPQAAKHSSGANPIRLAATS